MHYKCIYASYLIHVRRQTRVLADKPHTHIRTPLHWSPPVHPHMRAFSKFSARIFVRSVTLRLQAKRICQLGLWRRLSGYVLCVKVRDMHRKLSGGMRSCWRRLVLPKPRSAPWSKLYTQKMFCMHVCSVCTRHGSFARRSKNMNRPENSSLLSVAAWVREGRIIVKRTACTGNSCFY